MGSSLGTYFSKKRISVDLKHYKYYFFLHQRDVINIFVEWVQSLITNAIFFPWLVHSYHVTESSNQITFKQVTYKDFRRLCNLSTFKNV